MLRWMLPCKEEKVEPASRDSKDQKGLLDHPVVLGAHYIFRILSILLFSGGALFRPYIFFAFNRFFQSLKYKKIFLELKKICLFSHSTPGMACKTLSGITARIKMLEITNINFGGEPN